MNPSSGPDGWSDGPVSMTKPLPAGAARPHDTASLPAAYGQPAPYGGPAPYGQPAPYGGPGPYGHSVPQYPAAVVMPQQSNAEIIVAWVVTAVTLLYMLPWAVAASRRSTNSVLIAVATFFLAWTILGWLVLLVLAFLGPTVHSLRPVVVVAPPAPPPAGVWAHCPTDPPHVRRWWDGHAWTAHTTAG